MITPKHNLHERFVVQRYDTAWQGWLGSMLRSERRADKSLGRLVSAYLQDPDACGFTDLRVVSYQPVAIYKMQKPSIGWDWAAVDSDDAIAVSNLPDLMFPHSD